jgi:hypothetical protein
VTWTPRNSGIDSPYFQNLQGITYGNGMFVAVGDWNTILTSPDGVTWTARNVETPYSTLWGITYGNGTFVAVGDLGTLFTSPDGVTWTARSSETLWGRLGGVVYGNGTFVAVQGFGTIFTSIDGLTWTSRSSGVDYGLSGVTYGNGIFVAVGSSELYLPAPILTSPEGITWTPVSSGTSNYLFEVTYGNGTFVAVGDHGTILTSPDGVIWTPRSSGTSNRLVGITYGNGAFAAVGEFGTIFQSDPLPPPPTIELQSPFDKREFDACSLYSLPAFSWTAAESFKGYEIQLSTDSDFGSIPVKVKATGTQATINSSSWKKVLLLPGSGGGTIYWRVMGTRANKTNFTSDVRSIIVAASEPVEDATISSASKESIPELSWQNNCNIKFKVWFGSDDTFSKKSTYSFTVKNPTDNGGNFEKTLSPSQWKSIRRLVGDITGLKVYWYVESWDGLGRYARTEVMSFVLTD